MNILSESERLKRAQCRFELGIDDDAAYEAWSNLVGDCPERWARICIPTPQQMRMHLFYKHKTLFNLEYFIMFADDMWLALDD